MDTPEVVEEILEHHGVKGMRWGVRRKATVGPQEIIVSDRRKNVKTSGGAGHPATESAVRARVIGQKAKKSGLKSLSDQELRDYASRIQMEQNVSRLMFTQKSRGAQFADKLLGRKGSQLAEKAAQEGATRAGRSALNKATRKSIKVARIAAFA
jgi:hypothetical protein